MAFDKSGLDSYVTVNERIEQFYKEFPSGSLQSEMIFRDEKTVIVKAWAYRSPEDTHPGIGHSSCPIPGPTPYTRGSELENSETSAWGRAIAALGFEVKRGIATQHEIDMKQAPKSTQSRPEPPKPPSPPPNDDAFCTEPQRKALWAQCRARASQLKTDDMAAQAWLEREALALGVPLKEGYTDVPDPSQMRVRQYRALLAMVVEAQM